MNSRPIKKLLVSLSILLLALTAGLQARPQAAPQQLEFSEQLGNDDGAAMAVLYGGNFRGVLDLCDCSHPRGGLARRAGYVKGFKARFKQTPVLEVETGNFFSEAVDFNGRMTPATALQNEQIIRAFDRWGLDIVNLARPDVLYASRVFGAAGETKLASLPVVQRITSANAILDPDSRRPPEYLIREVRGPRIRGRIRVGFAGFAESARVSEGIDSRTSDIFAAARRVIPVLRTKCDLLIVVAHAEHETALRLAAENPEANVVIAGNAAGLFRPRTVGQTLVVVSAPGNTHQGDLRVYISKGGDYTFKSRLVELNATVPADPEASEYVEKARIELSNLRGERVR
jgi:2',3'-cyclic-nucleotide 2'-phosphodiesterase (5'-nucleotidase family)